MLFLHPSHSFHSLNSLSSLAKHICFGLRKAVFCTPKDGLSGGESLAFGSETYSFRKIKVAHFHPSSSIPHLSTVADNCTRIREKFASTTFLIENSSNFVLKRILCSLKNVYVNLSLYPLLMCVFVLMFIVILLICLYVRDVNMSTCRMRKNT